MEREREKKKRAVDWRGERRVEKRAGGRGRSMMRGPRGSSMSDRSGSLEHLISWQLWYMCREGGGRILQQARQRRKPGGLEGEEEAWVGMS